MCKFAKLDVLIVAKAVLDDPIRYSGGDYDCHYWCCYCNARTKDEYSGPDVLQHDLDCPVLVAQDLLTIA